MPPVVTVIIPVLFDAYAVSALLTQLSATPDLEIVVVDGAVDHQLDGVVAAHAGAKLRRTEAGRARQMNLGAVGATGEWLLFLHGDSILPAGWLQALRGLGPDVIGGWFQFALDDSAWQARFIERLTAWRVTALRLPYGDQGLFVRRHVFAQLRGFREWPLMEDVDFVRRLVRAGRVVGLPLSLRTSARRWRRDGWFRRSTANIALVGLYFLGVCPTHLARWYRYPAESAEAEKPPDGSARHG